MAHIVIEDQEYKGINFNDNSPDAKEFTYCRFIDCKLAEVDFFESDLSSSVFHNCDLTGAAFENTKLEKADLRTATNYSIDPDLNRIKKAKFAWPGITGLLGKYDIIIEY